MSYTLYKTIWKNKIINYNTNNNSYIPIGVYYPDQATLPIVQKGRHLSGFIESQNWGFSVSRTITGLNFCSGPSVWIGWKELRIRAASVAQRCPNALLYHSGVLPLKRSAECYHTDVYSFKKKNAATVREFHLCVCVCVCVCVLCVCVVCVCVCVRELYLLTSGPLCRCGVSLDLPEPQGSSK